MKENKKKIIIISLISILIVIIITIAVCFIIKNKNQQKEAKAFNKEAAANQLKDYEEGNFNFHDIKVIPSCSNEEDCILANSYFKQISYKEDNAIINEVLTKINNKTNEYYEKINSSNNDKKCNKYIKDLYYSPVIETYENDQYISIAVSNVIGSLCDKKITYEKGAYYIYSKENQKILANSEIMTTFNLTENNIVKSINESLKESKNSEIYKLSDIEYNFYISTSGELKVTFIKDDKKYNILIQELFNQNNQDDNLTNIDFE